VNLFTVFLLRHRVGVLHGHRTLYFRGLILYIYFSQCEVGPCAMHLHFFWMFTTLSHPFVISYFTEISEFFFLSYIFSIPFYVSSSCFFGYTLNPCTSIYTTLFIPFHPLSSPSFIYFSHLHYSSALVIQPCLL